MARPRGRPRKLCLDTCPEFFKVYIPDRSSQQLRVPPAFIKHFSGTIPSKAILKDLSGKVWHVDMEEVESSLFIKNGWQSFVSDHSLELGEFLVFRYDGDSLFNVTIYGRNACKKEESLAFKKTAIHVKKEEETEAENIFTVHNQFRKRKYSEIGHRSSSGETAEECEASDTAELTAEECEASDTAELTAEECEASDTAELTAEECEASDTAELVLPKNPYFIGSIRRGYPYTLDIPKRLVERNGIKMKPEMVLRDQSGKSWPVRIGFRKDGRVSFAKGWKDFCKDNCMGLDDKCIFEFSIGSGTSASREVQVNIIRASEGIREKNLNVTKRGPKWGDEAAMKFDE